MNSRFKAVLKGKGRDLRRKFYQAPLLKQDVKNPSEGARLIWIKDHNSRSRFKKERFQSLASGLASVYGTICNQ